MTLVPPPPPFGDGIVALERLTTSHLPEVVGACRDPEIARWTVVPSPYTEADARDWLSMADDGWRAGTEATFAMVDASTATLLGGIGIRTANWPVTELGYWVAAPARGRGIAARGVRLLSSWAFHELGAVRVEIVTDVENLASQRVAEKAGFQREGILRRRLEVKGRRSDCVMFSLLPADLARGE
jgi:RimJ/RimL family protein N-acetyltransferase